jgi:hypothetical protein
MSQCDGDKTRKAREREIIVAYLSYALEDVRALSAVAVFHLHMAIVSLTDQGQAETSEELLESVFRH